MSTILPNLKIVSYRQLRELEVKSLGEVNLIVGGNNSGKTTFLEAIRLLAARGSPFLIEDILNSHGEFQGDGVDDEVVGRSVANLFCGREFPRNDGGGIYIGTVDGSNSVSLEHTFLREFEETRDVGGEVEVIRRLRKVSKEKELGEDVVEAIEIKSFDNELFSRATSHPLVDFFGSSRRYSRFRSEELIQNIPVSFVPCRLPEKENLAEAWDAIVLTEDEGIVLDSLQLIEPRVRGLAFIQGGRGEKSSFNKVRADERQAVIRVEGLLRPVPLKAMGDGMMRILQLVLSALKARNGFLLIDELENGLHYSIQERVWELLFKMAERNRSQVFVTTHSLDCVKAFARVAVKVAQKGVLIKMNRDDDFETSVAEIKENELLDLISADIEIR